MKTSLSKLAAQHSSAAQVPSRTDSAEPLHPGHSLLWIGDMEHPALALAWRTCQQSCDAISVRSSLHAAVAAPPRQVITHIIVAQTNRHERASLAIDGPDLAKLRECFADVKTLVLRGPLVAPTTRLPPAAGAAQNLSIPAWVDSVSATQAPAYLDSWFRCVTTIEVDWDLRPVVVVASRYAFAESLIESLLLLFQDQGAKEPLVQWRRELTQRSGKGFSTVLWDESAAPPESAYSWRHRCSLAPHSRHVWMTDMATPQQQADALSQGVYQVLEKPTPLECLVGSLRAA